MIVITIVMRAVFSCNRDANVYVCTYLSAIVTALCHIRILILYFTSWNESHDLHNIRYHWSSALTWIAKNFMHS